MVSQGNLSIAYLVGNRSALLPRPAWELPWQSLAEIRTSQVLTLSALEVLYWGLWKLLLSKKRQTLPV